jgi:ATP-dependent Zn protease
MHAARSSMEEALPENSLLGGCVTTDNRIGNNNQTMFFVEQDQRNSQICYKKLCFCRAGPTKPTQIKENYIVKNNKTTNNTNNNNDNTTNNINTHDMNNHIIINKTNNNNNNNTNNTNSSLIQYIISVGFVGPVHQFIDLIYHFRWFRWSCPLIQSANITNKYKV